jgi:8-oxo-dGTP diphosphatase
MKTIHDSATPAHGQQIISVTAFIHRHKDGEHKVFLPRRAETKAFLPGLWEMPGGHVNFGEDIVAGLKREVLEEFNMEIAVGDPFASFTYVNKIKGSHSIEVVYFATFTSDDAQIQVNLEDHSEYRWFTKRDVEDIVEPSRQKSKRNQSVGGTTGEDLEIQAILKGFEILTGQKINTGLPEL